MSPVPRPVRILLLADSHLGFDHPVRPRVRRRRRGEDFLANHRRALRAAVDGKVDLVVHGGDVFALRGPLLSVFKRAPFVFEVRDILPQQAAAPVAAAMRIAAFQ